MDETRLQELEERFASPTWPTFHPNDVAALIAAVREAWAEHDNMKGIAEAFKARSRQFDEEISQLAATIERVKELAYGKPDMFITADSPPPHEGFVAQGRLRAALNTTTSQEELDSD